MYAQPRPIRFEGARQASVRHCDVVREVSGRVRRDKVGRALLEKAALKLKGAPDAAPKDRAYRSLFRVTGGDFRYFLGACVSFHIFTALRASLKDWVPRYICARAS